MKEKKNREWLQDTIGEIDDDLLLETQEVRKHGAADKRQKTVIQGKNKDNLSEKERKNITDSFTEGKQKEDTGSSGEKERKKYRVWKKTGMAAACISVFCIGSFLWKNGVLSNDTKDLAQYKNKTEAEQECERDKEQENEGTRNETEQNSTLDTADSTSDSEGVHSFADSIGTAETPQEMEIAGAGVQEGNTQGTPNAPSGESNTQRQDSDASSIGISIPKREVTLREPPGMEICMIGFFIYQGRVYVGYDEWLSDAQSLVGKRLGTATGLMEEWEAEDGYVELAGSVEGDFYEVKGYDPEFMLCMKNTDGEIWLFIHDNDLQLEKGSDIFENYLHISEKSYTVSYLTNEQWNEEAEKIPVNPKDYEKADTLLEAINKGEFVLTEELLEAYGSDVFYTEKQLYHLYLEMEDGLVLHLRIFEGGYVMFDGVQNACVKIESFK
uniref:hypothetical protein n=1 Tax=Agathobacter sp. TaxID=2021311 RepID=UPI00405677B2